MTLTTIGFDADDTLWQNERFFREAEAALVRRLSPWVAEEVLLPALLAAEWRNVPLYGYGVKGYVLSAIETAITASGGTVPSTVLAEILMDGRELLSHPLELLPGARETVETLSERFRLVLITKGDLLHQERKLEASGLAPWFTAIEIVSDKTRATYDRIFRQHGDGAERAMMIGNSMRSDVLPALEAGAWGVYVPQGTSWALEHAEAPPGHPRFHEITTLREVIDIACNL